MEDIPMKTYREFIDAFISTIDAARSLPQGNMSPAKTAPEVPEEATRILIFSPHPDDECIIGTLPLRFLRENAYRVVNVAVTQGSRKDRQQERFEELEEACRFLGFDVYQTKPGGLEKIKPSTRQKDPEYWARCTEVVKNILRQEQPQMIFLPHGNDFNGTHVGTHHLVMDALPQLQSDFSCVLVETEYWHPMSAPNLMVESPPEVLADLVAALSHHKGEVERNPYHIALPAWMHDNVRRGSEVLTGQGSEAPQIHFATLYRVALWQNGSTAEPAPFTRILTGDTSPASALAPVLHNP